jgi:FkbM family methyltransferase
MKNLELHVSEIISNKLKKNDFDAPPVDYFSWGRDSRHLVDNTERLPSIPVKENFSMKVAARRLVSFVMGRVLRKNKAVIIYRFRKQYASFDKTYQLMSDKYSKNLFAELTLMMLLSEKSMRLSSFTQDFIDSYEASSEKILNSYVEFPVYEWMLKKIKLENPPISFFTEPMVLNLHYTGRLYRYHQGKTLIEVEGGDIVIDAGVGWGDTTIYLAALADKLPGGRSYAFDILKEGMHALSEQCNLNPKLKNITPVLRALSDKDGDHVFVSSPSPGAKIVKEETGRKVETITIDTFSEENSLKKIDFIKMDIEGAELPALIGAAKTINMFKPKLAISVYHKWDDLLAIPTLIHSIRDDYNYYLDCTTGFGGEAVLFCR